MSLQFNLDIIPHKLSESNPTDIIQINFKGKSKKQKVKFLILRDLLNLDWQIELCKNKIEVRPPKSYDKDTIKNAMSVKREELISKNKIWISKHLDLARKNLANGFDVIESQIDPFIEVCETKTQHSLFRMLRYSWSSPYSDYVGRRIKLLIRDRALPNKPIIGIAALGSSIIHIPERDEFIGWDIKTRTKNLVYTMDAFVIGALPPYNYLLGGKLISYLLATNEVRKIYYKKYKNRKTIIDKREANSLLGIFTTSLYGRSSQYNRLKIRDELLYKEIGHTKGYGSLHLSNETIQEMCSLLKSKGINVNHQFGNGPSWVMRVIRTTGDLLGFDSNFLLKHSFKRNIYFIPLAKNSIEILSGNNKRPKYYNYTKKEVVEFWKERWLKNRKTNSEVVFNVLNFKPENFNIF